MIIHKLHKPATLIVIQALNGYMMNVSMLLFECKCTDHGHKQTQQLNFPMDQKVDAFILVLISKRCIHTRTKYAHKVTKVEVCDSP